MISYNDVAREDFRNIPIDAFWNLGCEKEHKMHRIHSYPAKFPAFITTKSIEFAQSRGINVESMGDVFCGCGTVAYEAKRNQVEFWGCDINPVATLIAKTKSRIYQSARLERYFEEIAAYRDQAIVGDRYDEANERLKYWYIRSQYNELYHLKRAIFERTPKNSPYQQFFLCAFSNILKPTSRWLAKSIKPQVDPNKKIVRVFPAFEEQFHQMKKAQIECDFESVSDNEIVTGSVLDNALQKPMVDLIVTSPPYVTSYEYADLHQLSSLWLDYAEDYRDLRTGSIGSKTQNYNFESQVKHLNTVAESIVFKMYNVDKNKAKVIAKYFLDMQKVSDVCHSMLNKAGMAFFVIGNTEYKNVTIDNAKHLCESMKSSGFKQIELTKRKISNKILTPYRDNRGKFTTDKTGKKVYSEEFIITGIK